MYESGMMIGLKRKEQKYKRIIKKLLNKQELDEEDKEFLLKQELL